MTDRVGSPTMSVDRLGSLLAVFAYSLGLGIDTVAIPLLALQAGYDAAAVGFLVAAAAGAQFTTRLALPWLLGRYPDRRLIGIAALGMALAFGLLAMTTALPVFVAAQLIQGASRAVFWTSSQTHAVRGEGRPVQRLVDLNVAGNAGTLVGPALGGILALAGLPVALATAAGGALVAVAASRSLRALAPYDRRQGAGTFHLLRRDGIDVACWASVVGGCWWSMMGSYVPVLAVASGVGSVGVGWLITASEGAGMAALMALRRLAPEHVRRVVRIAATVSVAALSALGLAALTATGSVAWIFAAVMVVGGASSGTITTLAPAMASLAAEPEEQGDALALSGTFRAGALLVAPAAVGGLLGLVGIPVAMIAMTAVAGLPGLVVGRRGSTRAGATTGAERARARDA